MLLGAASWQGRPIDKLFADIGGVRLKKAGKTIMPTNIHFFGLLVFIDEKNEDGQSVYSVMDGQPEHSYKNADMGLS